MALCEGPITGIGNVWISRDQLTYADAASQAKVPATLFLGSRDQAVWGTLSSADPDNAVAFSSTAYLADAALDLGSSPTVPDYGYSFRAALRQPISTESGTSSTIFDQPAIWVGFGPAAGVIGSFIDNFTGYCANIVIRSALDLSVSGAGFTRRDLNILDRWAQLTNTWIFW
jgi:hypothetical protein